VNPNLPVGGSALDLRLGTREALPEGVTQAALQGTYARFARELEGADEVDRSQPTLEALLVQLQLRHHFGQGWSADVVVPTGTITREADGQSEHLSGFGDLEIGGEYDFAALWGPRPFWPSLTLRLALALPTGRSGELGDPAAPSVVSLGNGAFGGVAELRLTQFVAHRLAIAPAASIRGPFSANESGGTTGTSTTFGLDAVVVPTGWLFLTAGVAYQVRGYTEEQTGERVVNSGGRFLAALAIASVRAGDRVTVGAGVHVPLYSDVNGRQIAESYSLLALVSLSFGKDGEHEHGHGHGGGHGP
jgi:hypothetical protein